MKKISNITNFVKMLVKYSGYFVVVFKTLQFLQEQLEQQQGNENDDNNLKK